MQQYLEALSFILQEGERRTNRTGIDTLSCFGLRLRFDLRRGFPAVTTKKLQFKSVVKELLFFLSGSTTEADVGSNIWSAWKDEEGELSNIYSKQWMRWEGPRQIVPVEQRLLPIQEMPAFVKGLKLGIGDSGNTDRK